MSISKGLEKGSREVGERKNPKYRLLLKLQNHILHVGKCSAKQAGPKAECSRPKSAAARRTNLKHSPSREHKQEVVQHQKGWEQWKEPKFKMYLLN